MRYRLPECVPQTTTANALLLTLPGVDATGAVPNVTPRTLPAVRARA